MRPRLRTQPPLLFSLATDAREEAGVPGPWARAADRPASSGGRGADPPTRLPQKPFPRRLQRPRRDLALPGRRETEPLLFT